MQRSPGPKPPAQPPRKRPPEPQEPPQWAEPAEGFEENEEPVERTVKEPAKPRLGRPGPGPGPGPGQSKSTKSKPKSKPKPTPPARSAQKPLRPARPAPKRKLEPPEPEPQEPEPDWQEEPAEPEKWNEPWEEETWQPKPAKPARQPRCDLNWTCFRCSYVLLFLAFQNVKGTFTSTQVDHVNTKPSPVKEVPWNVHAKNDNNARCRLDDSKRNCSLEAVRPNTTSPSSHTTKCQAQ